MQEPAQINARRPRPGTRKRLEPLALACLLTALVLGWCPLTALVAIVLGGMALHRMKRESPDGRTEERRGAGLAFAGMGIATAILLGELWLLGDLQTTVMDSMESQATAAIEAGLRVQAPGAAPASTPDAAELLWDDAFHAPDENARAAFAGAVAAQTGPLRQVSALDFDGQRAVSAGMDGTVNVYTLAGTGSGSGSGEEGVERRRRGQPRAFANAATRLWPCCGWRSAPGGLESPGRYTHPPLFPPHFRSRFFRSIPSCPPAGRASASSPEAGIALASTPSSVRW
jgi:hypothetical protein